MQSVQYQPVHGLRLLPIIVMVILLCGLMNVSSAAPSTEVHNV
jgi:hypothetical protein